MSSDPPLRKDWRTFSFLTAALVLTRLGSLVFLGDFDPVGDEGTYIKRGYAFVEIVRHWLATGQIQENFFDIFYFRGWHPPLSALLAGIPYMLGGVELARTVQAMIGIASGVCFFFLAKVFLGFRFGLLAYGLFIVNPYLLSFSTFLWSENLYILLTTLLLLWYYGHFLGEPRKEDGGVRRATLTGGVLMGLLWLCRSSFTPVFLGLLGILFFQRGNRRRHVSVFVLSGIMGFLISLPWDILIYLREGIFAHGTTIAPVHLATKFNNLGTTGWMPMWKHVNQLASAKGTHHSVEALGVVAAFLDSLDGRYGVVLSIIKEQFTGSYLFAASLLKRHFVWAFYPAADPSLNLLFLAYDWTTRGLLVWIGGLGLLFGALRPRIKWLLIVVFLANAAIAVIGKSHGRYIVANYPLLIIGLVALWVTAWRRKPSGVIVFAALAMVTLLRYPDYTRAKKWPAVYVEAVREHRGSPAIISDVVTLRPVRGCDSGEQMRIEAMPHQDIWIRVPGERRFKRLEKRILTARQPWIRLQIIQGPRTFQDSITVVLGGERFTVPLGHESWGDWVKLGESCYEVQWYGARKNYFDYYFHVRMFGKKR